MGIPDPERPPWAAPAVPSIPSLPPAPPSAAPAWAAPATLVAAVAAPAANSAWLPAQPAPAPAAPPQADRRSYAEWFAWASQQFPDEHQARVATEAAISVLRQGAEPAMAVAAGQQAATAPDVGMRMVTADKETQAYSAWYVWATQRMRLDPQRAHLAAAAGRAVQASGADLPAAQANALIAAGVNPAAALPKRSAFTGISLGDPAVRAILFGIACLVVPFFGFYFIILPFLGLAYSIRALTQSRMALGIPGVALNGLASLLTAALFFHML